MHCSRRSPTSQASWSSILKARSVRRFAIPLVLAGLAVAAASHAAPFPLRLLRQVPIEATGTPSALAFAPDGAVAYLGVGRSLALYDDAGAPIGAIALPGTVTGLAIAPQGARAYATMRDADAIAVLSVKPLKLLKTLAVPFAPSALSIDAQGRTLYVEGGASGRLLTLDIESGKIMASVHLDGRLEQMADNGYGHLFVAAADRDVVDVLDSATLRRAGSIPMPACHAPSGLAIDPVGRRLFVTCATGDVAVIDTDIGFTFQQLPGVPGNTRGLFVRAPTGKNGWKGAAFFASSRALLGAVQMLAFIRYADGGRLPLPAGSEVLAFDASHGRLWVALSQPAELLILQGGGE